jgi:hypothetical protein
MGFHEDLMCEKFKMILLIDPMKPLIASGDGTNLVFTP